MERQEMKEKAEVYYGDERCREKLREVLREVGLPGGVVWAVVEDIQELGYVAEMGFLWVKYLSHSHHTFHNILLHYDALLTAYVEPNRLTNLTGVKAKDFLFWLTLSEISVAHHHPAFITFKTPLGLSKSFPLSMFDF